MEITLDIGYPENLLYSDVSISVPDHGIISFVGDNGCGKSTILKMIAGVLKPDAGEIEIGETIKIGYFAQEEQHMDDSQRVIDYVKDIAEYVTTKDGQISASQLLERFLFTPDMQYAPIGKLSGGRREGFIFLAFLRRMRMFCCLTRPETTWISRHLRSLRTI